ncbi:MAG: hypothetical protein AVDCRST_MAG50-2970 [uncultured Acidimicrobiales bacterium]|uniref:DinB-like domain-containing protein n=1 Tax=uncultured Acidimicrobiales bacterium TaxID=310071 RepID=A0A6J4ITN6_9ACTN|nr:MAG: hypothetical protein AVDCRST_MAG50-2970 [uncultured Acidimicrobiales bacterium]
MATNTSSRLDSEFHTPGNCTACGYQPQTVSPSDAVVALRSFPRRFRAALAIHLDDPDPSGTLTSAPYPGGWSALEHAGHVRDILHALDLRLHRVLREDTPTLPETPQTPPGGANEQGPEVVLAALTVNAEQLARTVSAVPGSDWLRRARRGGQDVTVLELAREAVHEGVHHLKALQQVLDHVRHTGV